MKMQVTYDNGDVTVYKVKPRHLVDFEDEYGEFSESAKHAYALAHLASDSSLDFKSWLGTVDDITPVTESGDEGLVEQGEGGGKGGKAGKPVPTA